VLVLSRGHGVDLRELVLEQLELGVAGASKLAEALPLGLQAGGLGEGGGARSQADALLGAADAVEDLQLSGRERELAVLVLTVEGQKRRAEVAKIPDGRGAAVQIRAGATVGADPAGEDELPRAGWQSLGERLGELLAELEDPLDVGLPRARPHDSRPRAAAEEEVEGMREDRLARAGLTREHVQPRGQAQLRALDEEEVLDA
jgi:hypothetical protein